MARRRATVTLAAWLLAAATIVCAGSTATAGAPDPGTASAAAAPSSARPPDPRPELKIPEPGVWPMRPWSYAKVYTYNFIELSPVPSMVVDADGNWSEHIHSEAVVGDDIALKAARLVAAVPGTFETTKCTFPRHAIVYFNRNDKPVAAANVCFECEGILVWPDYKREDDWYENGGYERGETSFLRTLKKWRELFGDELGLPIDYRETR